MAFDFLDQQKVQEARLKAIQAGYDPNDVDSFIQSKQGVQKSASAIQSGALGIKDLPQEQRVDVANYLGQMGFDFSQAPEEKKDPFAAQKKSALQAVNNLEKLYGRGNAANVGTDKDLSLAGTGSRYEKWTSKNIPKDKQTRQDITIYNSQVALALATLTQAFGSGAPQEGESQRLIESAPNLQSSNKEAKEWFKSVKKLLGESDKSSQQTEVNKQTQQTGQQPVSANSVQSLLQPQTAQTQTQPLNTSLDLSKILASNPPGTPIVNNQGQPDMPAQQSQQLAQNDGNNLMDTILGKPLDASQPKEDLTGLQRAGLAVGNAAVPIMATLGGLGGGVVGAAAGGVGAVPGGIVGAGLGAAGGVAIRDNIRGLLNIENRDPVEILQDYGTDVARETAFEAVGAGVGRAAKFVAKPIGKGGGLVIKEIGNQIDDIPLKSIRVNPSQLRKFATKHGDDLAEYMVSRGYLGEDAIDLAASDARKFQQSFDDMVLRDDIKIPLEKVNQRFTDEIRNLSGGTSGLAPDFNKKIAKDITTSWKDLLDQAQRKGMKEVTPRQLTELRRAIDDVIPDSVFVEPKTKNTYLRLRRIYNDVVADAVNKGTKSNGLKGNVKDLGQELSRLYDFLEIAERQSGLGRGSLVANLTRLGSTGAGGIIGGMIGGPAGAVAGGLTGLSAESAMRNPEVLKYILQGKQAITPALQATGAGINAGINALPAIGGAVSHPLGNLLFPSQVSQEDQQRLEEEQARNGY